MMVQLVTVAITTATGGAFSQNVVMPGGGGRLLQYRYVPAGGGNNLATGADLTVSGSRSGFVYINHADIGTSAFSKAPRQPTSDVLGAASLYAAAGEPVEDHMYVGGEPLTVAIAQGGDTKSGTLYLWIG